MADTGLETLISELLKEYRRHRRQRWIARFVILALILGVLVFPIVQKMQIEPMEHTAIVDINGVIGIGMDASAERVNEGLRDAFENPNVKGIILRANSPGGSPVQSRRINQELIRLKDMHPNIPVYVVVDEICASGCYYAAVATNKIYADPASLIGSIGVRMDSFGFVDAMKKIGVERRLFTAGNNKGVLDPFLPLSSKDQDFVDQMLSTVHRQFVDTVKQGRGDRLTGDEATLFSGLFWPGEEAVDLGLIDGIGDIRYVSTEIIGAEHTVNYTPGFDIVEQISRDLGVLGTRLIASLKASSTWNLQF